MNSAQLGPHIVVFCSKEPRLASKPFIIIIMHSTHKNRWTLSFPNDVSTRKNIVLCILSICIYEYTMNIKNMRSIIINKHTVNVMHIMNTWLPYVYYEYEFYEYYEALDSYELLNIIISIHVMNSTIITHTMLIIMHAWTLWMLYMASTLWLVYMLWINRNSASFMSILHIAS